MLMHCAICTVPCKYVHCANCTVPNEYVHFLYKQSQMNMCTTNQWVYCVFLLIHLRQTLKSFLKVNLCMIGILAKCDEYTPTPLHKYRNYWLGGLWWRWWASSPRSRGTSSPHTPRARSQSPPRSCWRRRWPASTPGTCHRLAKSRSLKTLVRNDPTFFF